jgi:glycerate kinase
MRLLISPNAFKNSLTASEAAEAIRKGFLQSRLTCTCECFPVGDGGDGTGDLIIERLGGRKIEAEARDPFGRRITTYFGLIGSASPAAGSASDHAVPAASTSPARSAPLTSPTSPADAPLTNTPPTAVIEMANASGLRLLDAKELDPLLALSYGTGDLVRAALDNHARRIIIGMGGSATVDGGTGILTALGVRFLDESGNDLAALPVSGASPAMGLPASLTRLARIDTSGLDPRLADCEITILCDVDNRLLGPQGAAAVFGPQKGASPQAVQQLDAGLQRLAEVILQQTGTDLTTLTYGGTAGGAAAGLHGLLQANLVHGIDYYLSVTGYADALRGSDWVITGEGSIDEQTLQGKGPYGVARLAKKTGIPVIGLAGKVPPEKSMELKEYFDVLLSINHELQSLPDALRTTAANLTRVAAEIGNLLAQR